MTHVLVSWTDVTNYGEAVRGLSLRQEEVPSCKTGPGRIYGDLTSICERCDCVRGTPGSITQMPATGAGRSRRKLLRARFTGADLGDA